MIDYKRFVSYLFHYEGEERKRSVGYIRLEVRNQQCRIRIFMKNLEQKDNTEGKVWAFRRVDGQVYMIPMGKIIVKNEMAEACFLTKSKHFLDSGAPVTAFQGLAVFLGENQETYITVWDDSPLDMEAICRQGKRGDDTFWEMKEVCAGNSVTSVTEKEAVSRENSFPEIKAAEISMPEKTLEEKSRNPVLEGKSEEKSRNPVLEGKSEEKSRNPALEGKSEEKSRSPEREEKPEEKAIELPLTFPAPSSAQPEWKTWWKTLLLAGTRAIHGMNLSSAEGAASANPPDMASPISQIVGRTVPSPIADMKGREENFMQEKRDDTKVTATTYLGNSMGSRYSIPADTERSMGIKEISSTENDKAGYNTEPIFTENDKAGYNTEPIFTENHKVRYKMEAVPTENGKKWKIEETNSTNIDKTAYNMESIPTTVENSMKNKGFVPTTGDKTRTKGGIMYPSWDNRSIHENQKENASPTYYGNTKEKTDTIPTSCNIMKEKWDRVADPASASFESGSPSWEDLGRMYPHLRLPGISDDLDILRITLQDVGRLPRPYWTLGQNAFLLHGYSQNPHLILIRESSGKTFLGVPGVDLGSDRLAAEMFGFRNYWPVGEKGYWLMGIKL